MTGWTQFTVRFETKDDAQYLVSLAEASDERISYSESFENIARVRFIGYGLHDNAVAMLETVSPFDLALVADFNDTTDSGEITAYRSDGHGQLTTYETCPAVHRLSFEVTVGGLTETGVRAGNDFSLEQQYGESEAEEL